MILSKEINPTKNIYFIGSKILDELSKQSQSTVDFFVLYKNVNNAQRVSMQIFIFAIDWLFLLDAIKFNDEGGLEKCF